MADIEKSIEDVTKGLDAKQKERVREFAARQQEKLRNRIKQSREIAKQQGVVVGSVVALVGGVAAEGVRRKLIGRWAKKVQNQGIGLALAGIGCKVAAKWAGIPILHDLGDAMISQGGSVGSAEMIYGKEDPMVIALEGTVTAK